MTTTKQSLLGIAVSMMILPVPFVALRLKARRLKRMGLGVEDLFLLIALIVNTAFAITMIIATTAGNLGSHEEFSPEGLPIITHKHIVSFQCQYALQLMVPIVDGLTKLSILLLYRRIFATPKFMAINTVWCFIIAAWIVTFICGSLFQCDPISTMWLSPFSMSTPDKCMSTMPFYAALAYTDLLTDILVLALPIPAVWSLQLPVRKRIGVIGIFLLGIFVTAVGAVKIKIFYVTIDQIKHSADLSFLFAKTFYWSVIQTSIGIICACLPTFPPLFDSTVKGSFPNFLGSRTGLTRFLGSSGNLSFNQSRTTYKLETEDANSLINLPAGRTVEAWDTGNTSNNHSHAAALPPLPSGHISDIPPGALGVSREFDVKTSYVKGYSPAEV